MKVMLDTNVVLDHLLMREPSVKTSDEIFELISSDRIFAYLTTNSLTDIFYITKKSLGEIATKKAIRMLIDLLSIVSVDCGECKIIKPDDFLKIVNPNKK